MATYKEEYNNILQKYSEFKKCCNKFNFSIYFQEKFQEVIKWLIDNRTTDYLDEEKDYLYEENKEYSEKLNSKEKTIQYIFNIFYHVFKFEFIRMLSSYETTYNLNKLSNEKRLELINECIDYFCDFYKDYIQKIFINDLINDKPFIFLSEEDKNKYLEINNSNDRTYLILVILTRIRFKVIDYYIKDINNYLETIIGKDKLSNIYVFKEICEKLFDKDFVKKYYKNDQIRSQFELYFIPKEIFDFIYNIEGINNFKCIDFIPDTDIYYLIKNIK